jgi:hypothetical protein
MALHNTHFYHGTTRRYVASFGNIFNSIFVTRRDENGNELSREKVPLSYGPKQKYLYRLTQNPDLNERFSIKLPRISFELVEIKYDDARKTPSVNQLKSGVHADGSKSFQYNAVPYEFLFDVNIMAKNTDEALQIIEQVLPFFAPDYTMTINVIPELNHKLDIPVTINGIDIDDNWDETFKERRHIIWTLNMSMKGFLYAPTRDSKIILEADWHLYGFDDDGDGEPDEDFASGTETEK